MHLSQVSLINHNGRDSEAKGVVFASIDECVQSRADVKLFDYSAVISRFNKARQVNNKTNIPYPEDQELYYSFK